MNTKYLYVAVIKTAIKNIRMPHSNTSVGSTIRIGLKLIFNREIHSAKRTGRKLALLKEYLLQILINRYRLLITYHKSSPTIEETFVNIW